MTDLAMGYGKQGQGQCGIAVHFLVLLFTSGVPVLYLVALLVLMTLFIAALLF